MSGRVVLVAGTRPEFVKLHPLALALGACEAETILVTTEQHTGEEMRDDFVDGLEWSCPVERLRVEAQAPLPLLSAILAQLPGHLRAGDVVVVEGDTNSVLAASLVANKLLLRLAHVEAGLRSYDLRMPEEHNRRLCDHIADDLFAPTEADAAHLREELCPGRTHVMGNTVLDAVRLNAPRLRPSTETGHILVTIHRQENLSDPVFVEALAAFLEGLRDRALFPLHPRTRDLLGRTGVLQRIARGGNVHIIEPLDYLAFLAAMRDARVILTDSGGVQEEATAPEIRRPVVVLRRSTERVVAIEAGCSVLAPFDAQRIASLVDDLSWYRSPAQSPFGNGHAAERIAAVLTRYVT